MLIALGSVVARDHLYPFGPSAVIMHVDAVARSQNVIGMAIAWPDYRARAAIPFGSVTSLYVQLDYGPPRIVLGGGIAY
jgi:hypothetical protein